MKKLLLILPLLASLLLFWCGNTNPDADCDTGNVCTLPEIEDQQTDLTWVAQQTLQAIKTQDFQTLSTLVSSNGVRFSPYEYVNLTTDIVLTQQQIANALALSNAFTWWAYDGSGEPISLWIGHYRNKFVYDVDFASAPIQQWNQVVQRGNIINNLTSIYAGKHIIEYHFTGFDAQYGGMDRRSLFLVFDQENSQRKLIGIVHGQRTS